MDTAQSVAMVTVDLLKAAEFVVTIQADFLFKTSRQTLRMMSRNDLFLYDWPHRSSESFFNHLDAESLDPLIQEGGKTLRSMRAETRSQSQSPTGAQWLTSP